MMEADSVHATLELAFDNVDLYAPSDYYTLMRTARPLKPYDVRIVDFKFFKDFEHADGLLTSIRPGKKAHDPVVTDLRALQYLPSGDINYKLRHTDDWAQLPIRMPQRRDANGVQPGNLYSARPKIKADKFKQLKEFKPIIPIDYHAYYDSLPHF